MERCIYDLARAHEDSYWWFQARRQILVQLMEEWAPPGARILDAGCMTGFIADALRERYRVSLVDPAPEAVSACAAKGLPVVRGSIRALPYRAGAFDLVGCFDVLYHRGAWPLEEALGEVHRVLKPDGILIAAEPAYQWLFGEADVVDHARERFTAAGLARRLEQAGFTVRRRGYFNSYLAPLIIASRLLRKLSRWARPGAEPAAEFGQLPGRLNDVFTRIFRSEALRVVRGGFPFGISVLCVAQK